MNSASAALATRPSLVKILTAALIAGLGAAVLNNVYGAAFTAATGNSLELIGPVSITLASLIPMLVAGVAYYVLARFVPSRANLIFVAGSLLLAALSLAGPLTIGQLPDGSTTPAFFLALTLPMHVIAGLVAALGLPRLVNR
jgi:hypothetical protein